MKPALVAALALILAPQSPVVSANLSPGAIALLINTDPAQAKAGVEQALRDPHPAIRIVAARVAGTLPLPTLSTELLSALARESDPTVAAEEVHDVLLLAGSSAEGAIEAQLQRNGRNAVLAYAEGLGRTAPDRLASKVAGLFALAPDAGADLTRIVRMSGAVHPDRRDDLYRAWMKVAPQNAWRSLLSQTFLAPGAASGGSGVLVSALNSDRPDIRAETVWFIVGKRGMPDVVLDAALPHGGNAPLDWEAFGRELVARSHKHQQTPDRAEFLRSALGRPEPGALDLRFNPSLTAEERAVVKEMPGAPIEIDPWFPATAVTAPSIAAGGLASLLQAARCEPSAGSPGVAIVSYAKDGRPQRVEVSAAGLSPGCQTALTTLARLTLEDPDHAATQGPQMLVLPLDEQSVACISDAPGPHAHAMLPARVDRRRVQAPAEIKDTRPYYPPEAQRQGIEGPVMVEAVIGPRGCVPRARVLRSLSPAVDAAALAAATRTLFTPPVVEGEPGAVVMTMTINFGLAK